MVRKISVPNNCDCLVLKVWDKYDKRIDTLSDYDRVKILKELDSYAKEFLQDNYGFYFDLPILINNRFTRALAAFSCVRSPNNVIRARNISINKKFLIAASYDTDKARRREIILQIFQHELIHYACFLEHKDFNDGSYGFEQELAKFNTISSGATARKKRISTKKMRFYRLEDLSGDSVYTHKVKNSDCDKTRASLYCMK